MLYECTDAEKLSVMMLVNSVVCQKQTFSDSMRAELRKPWLSAFRHASRFGGILLCRIMAILAGVWCTMLWFCHVCPYCDPSFRYILQGPLCYQVFPAFVKEVHWCMGKPCWCCRGLVTCRSCGMIWLFPIGSPCLWRTLGMWRKPNLKHPSNFLVTLCRYEHPILSFCYGYWVGFSGLKYWCMLWFFFCWSLQNFEGQSAFFAPEATVINMHLPLTRAQNISKSISVTRPGS